MVTSTSRFLFADGIVVTPAGDAPSVSSFLQTHPGAYTTTRTHNDAVSLLFWDRHLNRLSNSLQILLNSNVKFVFGPHFSSSLPPIPSMNWESLIQHRVGAAMSKAIPVVLNERPSGQELAITTLIGGNCEPLGKMVGKVDAKLIDEILDVYLHIGMYVPSVFGTKGNGAHLAIVGRRRDLAEAKYSDWASRPQILTSEKLEIAFLGRLRKPLEKLRPPSATELLLSDNGDRVLEGTVTNFFVVCRKEYSEVHERSFHDEGTLDSYELQTASINDGVLPGIIRQLVIEICLSKGISIREVSPSWSERDSWKEAFITSSLRLVQHVETIEAPSSWTALESKSWSEISWVKKQFKGSPGIITSIIQSELMEKANFEGYSLACLIR